MWGLLGLGALNAGLDIFGGFGRAARIRAETAEAVRRFTMKGEKTISEATAAGAASGITADSESLTKTLTDMSTELKRQADWMRAAGSSQANAAALSGGLEGAESLFGSVFRFGQSRNWFR
jgi:hypothetical protein